MSMVQTVAAVVTALIFLMVGGFSVLSLLWGDDLLERDEDDPPSRTSRAA